MGKPSHSKKGIGYMNSLAFWLWLGRVVLTLILQELARFIADFLRRQRKPR